MRVIPLLFEDHLVAGFRPVAWSLPTYEIRCGIYNLRERIEILHDAAGDEPRQAVGGLLCRPVLEKLHGTTRWGCGEQTFGELDLQPEDRILLLNGRLGPRFDLLAELWKRAAAGAEFLLADEAGSLAQVVSGHEFGNFLGRWRKWCGAAQKGGFWSSATGTCPPLPAAAELVSVEPLPGTGLVVASGGPGFAERLGELAVAPLPFSFRWIWDLVSATGEAIGSDLTAGRDADSFGRSPFGLFPAPDATGTPTWLRTGAWLAGAVPAGAAVSNPEDLWIGQDVRLGPGLAVDTAPGPVILDHGVEIEPHVFLQGPLYLGPGCCVKAGARLYGESSFGTGCRVAGEIGESSFGDFANKQHDGFVGHAVLGSWINLGAMTTCSDLKNNYGNIRVDLGAGAVHTGQRFVGLLMGDHAKTAIGTLFNTGTCVGFASNIFGAGMSPKQVGNFRWGGGEDSPGYDVEKALETAAVVLSRRGCRLTPAHETLFRFLA